MAMVLMEGKIFRDKFGYEHSNYYAVIDHLDLNKKEKYAIFSVNIFKDKESRLNNEQPIETLSYCLNDEDYNDYRVDLDLEGDPFRAAYVYTSLQKRWIDWQSDELN